MNRRRSGSGLGGLLTVAIILSGLTPRDSLAAAPQDVSEVAPVLAGRPDLAGSWVLNEDESDDLREAIARQGGGGQEGRRGGAGRTGGRRSGDGGSGEERGFRGRRGGGPGGGGAGGFARAPRTLEITQTDAYVSMATGQGRSTKFFTDGRSEERDFGQGSGELRAFWDHHELVVERQGERGRFRQTYALSADGRQLFVTVVLEGGPAGGSLKLRRVYDRSGNDSEKGG